MGVANNVGDNLGEKVGGGWFLAPCCCKLGSWVARDQSPDHSALKIFCKVGWYDWTQSDA